MKKFMKKAFCLSLVGVMAVGALTACGTKNSGSTGEGNTNGSADSGKFLIGGLGPLTGEAASYGISVKQGAEIAVEEINKAGGVKVGDETLQLELKFADDEASGEVAMSAYNSLMDSGIQALLGTVTSGAGLAIADKTNEDGILQITPSGSAADLTQYSNAFRLCFTDPLQGETMAEYAVKTLGYKKIAVIYNNADEYSTGVKEAFTAKVKELGGEVVAEEAFVTNAVDFTTQLTTIKGTDAEIIFVPAYYQDAAYITTQAAELGITLPFIGSDGWDGVLANIVDPAALEGAVFLSPFLATDENPAVQSFVTTYNEKYKATPDQFAADGYDTVYVIKAALEKAGSTKSEDLIKAMTEIEVKGLTGDVTFTEDGEPNKGAKFVEIKNGEYIAKTN
ncbi:amino acid-binding protein [Anaerocolumna cellulosilytica]|uniref:Amino acid-binding protein n=1 Tax=Anaerocolumna cellulosilytica TaxID=433286 RepID=A0A6S6RAJ4_9FIRM|nr:ABC transporter substrate-binding protein [Anaerocolumna cellulosilytica]MBB5196243.1 branched-chain amino acid transport system substrate-binding protein [Anaerocolumna cellulosilytica]BCJ96272.1 amino acid-binding protein [Anaerocolumna cellulosilytica]